jgi:hypothetical protein
MAGEDEKERAARYDDHLHPDEAAALVDRFTGPDAQPGSLSESLARYREMGIDDKTLAAYTRGKLDKMTRKDGPDK